MALTVTELFPRTAPSCLLTYSSYEIDLKVSLISCRVVFVSVYPHYPSAKTGETRAAAGIRNDRARLSSFLLVVFLIEPSSCKFLRDFDDRRSRSCAALSTVDEAVNYNEGFFSPQTAAETKKALPGVYNHTYPDNYMSL